MGEIMAHIEGELGIKFNEWQTFHGERILRRLDYVIRDPILRFPKVTQILSERRRGKTFMAAAIAAGLSRRGYKTAIYSRGSQHTEYIKSILHKFGDVDTRSGRCYMEGHNGGSVAVCASLAPGYTHTHMTFVDDCDGSAWWEHASFHKQNTNHLVFLETDEP
jgi:hypothetical protein